MATDGRNADEVDISSLSITAPGPPPLSQADATVREYLVKASSAFADVDELRERVCCNEGFLSPRMRKLTAFKGMEQPRRRQILPAEACPYDEQRQGG